MSKKSETSWQDSASDWLVSIIIAVALAFCIRTFLVEPYMVEGSSMYPTLVNHERLVVDKLSYFVTDPKKGEIVVFLFPKDQTRDFIKRVIAVGGDTVEMQQGKVFVNGKQLNEKQKVKFIYGVLEKQFHGYFNKARKMNGVTGENLMIILESRLDNVVFRLGFARTRKEARQSVRHGHFTVNGKRVDIPSYRVKAGDVVAVGEKFRDLLPIKEALISSERFEVPGWLEVDIEKLSGNVLALPTREQISGDINEQLIVELYSK